jgi:hypothetical protein
MNIGTDSVTRCLTRDLHYYINNYGEKKLVFGQFFILRVLWFSPVTLSSYKATTNATLATR